VSTTEPQSTSAPSAEAAATAIRKARGSLSRYHVLAIVTGVMLLILVVEMGIKYVLGAVVDVKPVMPYIEWVPFAHGWIYVVYLVTVADLWSKMRWGFGRLVTMVLAGVVPVMSFVLERKIRAEAEAKLAALEERFGA
jgi:integral membrane protein